MHTKYLKSLLSKEPDEAHISSWSAKHSGICVPSVMNTVLISWDPQVRWFKQSKFSWAQNPTKFPAYHVCKHSRHYSKICTSAYKFCQIHNATNKLFVVLVSMAHCSSVHLTTFILLIISRKTLYIWRDELLEVLCFYNTDMLTTISVAMDSVRNKLVQIQGFYILRVST
jgi:hypothetical protein